MARPPEAITDHGVMAPGAKSETLLPLEILRIDSSCCCLVGCARGAAGAVVYLLAAPGADGASDSEEGDSVYVSGRS